MEIIRKIYKDYEIIINYSNNKSDEIEIEIIITPHIESLYKWMWERHMVHITWEQYSSNEEPENSQDKMKIYILEYFCGRHRNVYNQTIKIPDCYKTNESVMLIGQDFLNTVEQEIDKRFDLKKLLWAQLINY